LGLRDKLRELLSIKDTPHRLAMAFAIGIFIGMSPLFGIHTILGIALAWMFKLNRLVTVTGVYITNPWTIIPIYTFSTYIGGKCLGMKQVIPDIDWGHITFSHMLNEFRPLLMPFILGTLLVGFVSAVIAYIVIHAAVKKAHSHEK